MIKKICMIICLAASLSLLAGCSLSLESVGLGKLSGMLDSGNIVCTVSQKEGQTLLVEVIAPDSHYDEGDILYITYTAITGGKSIEPGDTVTFTYDYINGVTVMDDEPHICVESIMPTEYIPPETEETTE